MNKWNNKFRYQVASCWLFILSVYRVLVGKPEGKRTLGRPRRSWKDTIKMDLQEVGWEGINCIDVAQDRGK